MQITQGLNRTSPFRTIPMDKTSASVAEGISVDPSAAAGFPDHAGEPHAALFFVLAHLRLPELLSFKRVCRSFWGAIAGDHLLWRDVVVEPPLSAKLTDDALWEVTSKANGRLRCLALLDCWRISDSGVQRVVDANPFITKLYLPGCTHVTADGVVRMVRSLVDGQGVLRQIQLRGISNVSKDHLGILNTLIQNNYTLQRVRPLFYTTWRSQKLGDDDDRPIDIDTCPKCNNSRLVFDCTREKCRMMEDQWTQCRGCLLCIPRCEDCGGCADVDALGEESQETVCSHLLCLQCWLLLPKCNTCNLPYCKGHMPSVGRLEGPAGYVCEVCLEREALSRALDEDSDW